MSSERPKPAITPCLRDALRQASRALSRLYDQELRRGGLRTTQYSLLARLSYAGDAGLVEGREIDRSRFGVHLGSGEELRRARHRNPKGGGRIM